jgi:hypothetical protein
LKKSRAPPPPDQQTEIHDLKVKMRARRRKKMGSLSSGGQARKIGTHAAEKKTDLNPNRVWRRQI